MERQNNYDLTVVPYHQAANGSAERLVRIQSGVLEAQSHAKEDAARFF